MTAIDEAIASLPENSPYRVVLKGIWSENEEQRRAAKQELMKLSRPSYGKIVALPEALTRTVLRASLEIPAPPTRSWGVNEIVSSLIGSVTPSMFDLVRANYEKSDENTRLALLTLVAATATEEGARLIVELVRAHGWTKWTHQRLFSELSKNLPYANILFPDLLEAKQAPMVSLGDMLIRALHGEHLDPERLEGSEIETSLTARIDALVAEVEKNRGGKRSGDSVNAIGELAMRYDLAGYIGPPGVIVRLHQALALPETWACMFAIVSLLRRKAEVPHEPIVRVAKDPATRATLYVLLKDLGVTSRIPAEYRTRDAFAEANMVEWLSHPGELGEPPAAIEKMAITNTRHRDKDVSLYVWRFRAHDGKWKAGVSGPYDIDAPEGPLRGSATFSRFDAWEKCSAEEHASAVLKTLQEWAKAHA